MSRRENWIKHDTRSRTDPKMAGFISHFGMQGYGAFWALLEILDYQNDHEFDIEQDGPGIAADLRLSPSEFLPILIGMIEARLLVREGNRVFQSKMKQTKQNEANEAKRISEVRKAAGRTGGLKSGEVRGEAKQESLPLDGSKTKQTEAKHVRREEKRVDISNTLSESDDSQGSLPPKDPGSKPEPKSKKITSSNGIEIPSELKCSEVEAALDQFIAYRARIKKPFRDADSVHRLLRHWTRFTRADFVEAVDTSIRNGWQGLFDPEPKKAAKKNTDTILSAIRSAVSRFGQHQYEKALASLPEEARAVVRSIGWGDLCRAETRKFNEMVASAVK